MFHVNKDAWDTLHLCAALHLLSLLFTFANIPSWPPSSFFEAFKKVNLQLPVHNREQKYIQST